MKQGLAIMLMNALAAELGYEVKPTRRPDGSLSNIIRLDNKAGDFHDFKGPTKFEDALNWLRKKYHQTNRV